MFNTVLTSSSFPAEWKVSKIVPNPIKSDPTELSHRPISILPALSKAIEIVMRDQMVFFVENLRLSDCFQSGFRSKHGTSTAMLMVTSDIQFSCDRKLTTVLLLLDFSKAFDNIVHSLLCSKLSSLFRFHGTAVELIRSYLSDRYQCVCVDGMRSGTELSPWALGLFCSPYLSMIDSISDCINRINLDLERLHKSTIENGKDTGNDHKLPILCGGRCTYNLSCRPIDSIQQKR
jgi:hypothetical protein